MSLFLERLYENLAAAAPADRLKTFIEHVIGELRRQDPSAGPVTKLGDVADDLEDELEAVLTAVTSKDRAPEPAASEAAAPAPAARARR